MKLVHVILIHYFHQYVTFHPSYKISIYTGRLSVTFRTDFVGMRLWPKSGQDAVKRDLVFISEVTPLVTAQRTTRVHAHIWMLVAAQLLS